MSLVNGKGAGEGLEKDSRVSRDLRFSEDKALGLWRYLPGYHLCIMSSTKYKHWMGMHNPINTYHVHISDSSPAKIYL